MLSVAFRATPIYLVFHGGIAPILQPEKGTRVSDPQTNSIATEQKGKAWHTLEPDAVADELETDLSDGLSEGEAKSRLVEYGPNQLRKARTITWWEVLLRQFKSLVVLLLVAAALLAFGMGETLEGFAIVMVIVLNAGVGFITEYRANRAMEALQKLGAQDIVVVRGGNRRTIPATDVVPGDLIALHEGDSIPADGRLVEAAGLQVDEAPLTGESVPVVKYVRALEDEDTPLADRDNMAYKGTHVASGNGLLVICGTGMDTEIGHVSELVAAEEEEETPLEERLARMGRRLIVLCLGVAVVVALAGILRGEEVLLMIEAGIALAIAAVPEGLPAVATITLAVGMRRMVRQNALIRRLAAVETLGSATCVCTDKTGTLTRNEMTVNVIALPDRSVEVWGSGYAPEGQFVEDDDRIDAAADEQLRRLLLASVLCNNATLGQSEDEEWKITGDPTEAALVVAARKAGMHEKDLRDAHPEQAEFAFSSETMMMGTVNAGLDAEMREDSGLALCVKGAPTRVLECCSRILERDGRRDLNQEDRDRLETENQSLAEEGLRMLAVAWRPLEEEPKDRQEAYSDLTWLGLAGIADPPREEVRETVDTLTKAGIKTVMITGDQPATAARIASVLHIAPEDAPTLTGAEVARMSPEELAERLAEVEVFARVNPEQKVDILNGLQERGEICAMLGDGVNDAVALKGADIGVAMGIKGTDVAKETADMVLLDDRFVTVGKAVHQGRIIYSNIKKFVHYLFSCNLSEVGTMLLASLAGHPLPLLPLQILWLNMITDVLPALSLAMEPGEKDIMEKPPRSPDASLLDPKTVKSILGYGFLMTVATLAAFFYGVMTHEPAEAGEPNFAAITMSFLTIGFAQLFHVFDSRKERKPMRGGEWFTNRYVLGAVVVTVLLQLAAVYAPGLPTILKTQPPTGVDWLVIAGCALMPVTVGQVLRRIRTHREDSGEPATKGATAESAGE